MASPKILEQGLTTGLVAFGLFGVARTVSGFQWGRGLELITTLFTLALCLSYFLFQRERKTRWYRILMVWTVMLMLSYLTSFFTKGTVSYTIMEDIGISQFAIPLFIWFGITIPVFSKEAIKPKTVFEFNKNPLLILLGSAAIFFGFWNGLIPFIAAVFSMPSPPGGWGALGLCETAVFGIVMGFLILLKPSKWLVAVTAICTSFMLITGVFPHFTDLVVYASLLLASAILVLKRFYSL
jgi:hypothetical protein